MRIGPRTPRRATSASARVSGRERPLWRSASILISADMAELAAPSDRVGLPYAWRDAARAGRGRRGISPSRPLAGGVQSGLIERAVQALFESGRRTGAVRRAAGDRRDAATWPLRSGPSVPAGSRRSEAFRGRRIPCGPATVTSAQRSHPARSAFAATHQPQFVIRLGDLPTLKACPGLARRAR